MITIDAVARQIPGILGSFDSVEEERTASPDVYTRPEVLVWKKKKYRVPKVLLSGDHKEIELWKNKQLARKNDKLMNRDTESALSAVQEIPISVKKTKEEWKAARFARNKPKLNT